MRIEHWFYTIPLRVRSLFRRRQLDAELDEELRYHIERQIELNTTRGMSPDDARTAALRAMGGIERRKDECRDARAVTWLTNALQDLGYGTRLLGRAPGFATAALLTIALGIGATTAMFSVVHGVVLEPLPFGEPERLVRLWTVAPKLGLPRAAVGVANARDWREQNRVFEDIALVRTIGNFNLTGEGEPERLLGARVTSNLFPLLRVSPLIGRTFTEEEDEIDSDRVVLLSYGLWHRRFGGNPDIVGRQVRLSGEPHTVVGVMKPDFTYPGREFQLWVPLSIPPEAYANRESYGLAGVARLRDGVTLERARADMSAISARLARQYPATNDSVGVEVVPLLEDTISTVRTPLYVLLGAVGGMLLIGCANLANLLLSRALNRRRELVVRATLGASRGRLIAQSVTELLPLFIIGGILGIVAARWALSVVVPRLPTDLPRAENIGLQLPVLAVAAATLGAITLLAGIWPALSVARVGLSASVAELSRSATSAPRRTRARDVLVVSQIAMTLLLLVGAAVLMRSFAELRQVNPGFDSERVLSAHLAVARSKHPGDREIAEVYRQMLDRIRVLPGVEWVGMVNRLPLAGGTQNGRVELEDAGLDGVMTTTADWRSVSPDYFRAMGIRLVRGRSFTDADHADAPFVGIIDERLAQAAWPDQDPIGRRFRIGLPDMPWVTIVGVVGRIRHDTMEEETRPQVYWNYLQRTQDRMVLVVKTRSDPAALTRSVTAVVRAVDPDLPLYDVRTLDAVVERSLARRWLQTVVLGSFAAIALLLASIGVYGVIAYAVGQRLREFGIRMALGARRGDIVSLVLRRGARLFLVGAVIGIAGAVLAVRVLTSLVYGVSPLDPPSFVAATAILLAVGLTACYLPAQRAARADPTVALRSE
jgi:putative ABC transport system permease protein